MESILDAVRNRLLDFVLGLQEIDPEILDSDRALTGLPQEEVNQVISVSIYGDHNVVASGREVSQQVSQIVESMNRGSLSKYLKSIGLQEHDIHELEAALDADGKPPAGVSPVNWLIGLKGAGESFEDVQEAYRLSREQILTAIGYAAHLAAHTPPAMAKTS